MKKINAAKMQCAENACKTCPFESNYFNNMPGIDRHYHNIVNFQATHLCHSTNNDWLCRGARNIQIKIAYALAYINEPTDEAFQAELEKVNTNS